MKLTSRNIHRDLGYFYLGLVIAFSISGIFLNHRQLWHPSRYKAEVKAVNVAMPADEKMIDENFAKGLKDQLGMTDNFRRFRLDRGQLKVSFEKNDVEIDLKTGKGEIIRYVKVPVLGQMTQLHQDTSQWWIYYSDIFGLAMLLMAVTGILMIPEGRLSFKERGWKLALLGLIFPLIFLFLLS
jgi:uncharacterized protein